MAFELSVVIPVYNEEGAIADVLEDWRRELERLHVDYEIRVYNDCSKDNTECILREAAQKNPRLVVSTNSHNLGHGGTVLRGYREALGEWVFQVDGDNEITPAHFEAFWSRRKDYDFLLGWREQRHSPLGRRLITFVARWTVRWLFGPLRDVNCPYRLIRHSCLKNLLPLIPPNAFAPNVILSGLVSEMRVFQGPVQYCERTTGKVSIVKWKLWKAAVRSFWQTLRVAFSTGARP